MKRKIAVLLPAAIGLGLLAFSGIERDPKLIYNPSPSAPIGWYKISPTSDLAVGDLVAAWLPDNVEKLVHQRRYLPEKTPIIKTIAAEPGGRYCVLNGTLKVAGQPDRPILLNDSQGLDMPGQPEGCRRLNSREYLLVSDRVETSFDSRYFGPVLRKYIMGKAVFVGDAEGSERSGKLDKGGARGMGAQGKIKGDGTNPSLSHCLHIDFYSTIFKGIVPKVQLTCSVDGAIQGYQFPIDQYVSRGELP